MKIFHVARADLADYDEYDSFICAANSEAEVRAIHPSRETYKWSGSEWKNEDWTDRTWPDPNTLKVTHIGEALEGITGVLCASFNAG